MKEVYDLHQYTECAIIHFRKNRVYSKIIPTSNRSPSILNNWKNNETSIPFCTPWPRFLRRSTRNTKIHSRDDSGNFTDALRQISCKKKRNWNANDILLIQAVSDHICSVIETSPIWSKKETRSFSHMHYAFVIPSEWPEEMRERLIRPMFIMAGLISRNDNKDRVLFISDIESICYSLQNPGDRNRCFQRGQNTLLCRLVATKDNGVCINLDSISMMNTLFDFPKSVFFPKITGSRSLSVTPSDIKKCIETFIKSKSNFAGQSQLIEMMVEEIYSKYFKYKRGNRNYNRLQRSFILKKEYPRFTKQYKKFMKFTRVNDICAEIAKLLFDTTRDLLPNSFSKEYRIMVLEDRFTPATKFGPLQLKWLNYTLAHNKRFLNSISKVEEAKLNKNMFYGKHLMEGAGLAVIETVQNSDMYCRPRILPEYYSMGAPSVFLNSSPNVTVNINISLESTLLSCSILDSRSGCVKEVLDHNLFTIDKCLPSLQSFYDTSDITTLNTNEKFIAFADKYLPNYSRYFKIDKRVVVKMEAILNNIKPRSYIKNCFLKCKNYFKKTVLNNSDSKKVKIVSSAKKLVQIDQQKYSKKAFPLIYMIYIKYLLSRKLSSSLNIDKPHTRVGYLITIEKIVLDNIIGTKEDLEDLVLKSGLVPKDSPFKKLRIITQEDGILSEIKKCVQLDFPLKSYFVLAQLHEDYIQLTLNQVVVNPGLQQEAIILQDNIIRIPSIYDSLCHYMWKNLTQDTSLIRLCQEHENDDEKILELFSLKTKAEFMLNLKDYISNNILAENVDLQNIQNIPLNKTCRCQVDFTIEDILNIAFRPVLQQLAITIQSSLINKQLFGKYWDIKYLFSLVYFNNNKKFQHTIAKILEEETEDFNQEQGIETTCVVLRQLPNQLFKPTIKQRVLTHKSFETGTLQQVFSENYGFTISQPEGSRKFVYKTNRTDTNHIEIDNKTAFPLFKRGDIIKRGQLRKVFYLNLQHDLESVYINIELHKFKTLFSLKNNGTVPSYAISETVCKYIIRPKKSGFTVGDDIPIMISVVPKGESSSLCISVKIVGEDSISEEFGEPMTLDRL